jgi:TP901-1 family phage major tail protein
MPVQRGRDLLIKLQGADNQFTTVGGIRTKRLALNSDTVDVTHAESAGRWRELLEGAGMRRASISGSGVFKDQDSNRLLRQIFFDGTIRRYQIIVPGFGTIEGPFQISSLDYRGEHVAELTFEIALESAGELTFQSLGA